MGTQRTRAWVVQTGKALLALTLALMIGVLLPGCDDGPSGHSDLKDTAGRSWWIGYSFTGTSVTATPLVNGGSPDWTNVTVNYKDGSFTSLSGGGSVTVDFNQDAGNIKSVTVTTNEGGTGVSDTKTPPFK